MTTAIAPAANGNLSKVEQVLVTGNLANLSEGERVNYYNSVCNSLGLNPLTRPFDYIAFQGKLQLYARRDCADQLRKIHHVSVTFTDKVTTEDGVRLVTAKATMPDGRCDEATGAVFVGGLKGEPLANAYMKAETKAKRRATLSICGLGFLDETEVETIPHEQPRQHEHKAEPAPRLSEGQVKVIEALLETHEKDWRKLFAYYHVNHLSEIPASEFERIKKQIEAAPLRSKAGDKPADADDLARLETAKENAAGDPYRIEDIARDNKIDLKKLSKADVAFLIAELEKEAEVPF